MKRKSNYRRINYLISVKSTKAFAADKVVGLFSGTHGIVRGMKNANRYLTKRGAASRINRIAQENHFASEYSFHIAEYDNQTGYTTIL